MRLLRVAVASGLTALLAPGAAMAEPQQLTFRYGPVRLAPYQLKNEEIVYGVPKPEVDGSITAMEADIVDADGRQVPIQRTMLHHVAFVNIGSRIGERRDPSCYRYVMFDSESVLPLLGDRFYAVGEERAKVDLPPGYGYPVKGGDQWGMGFMLMNHRNRPDTVWIEYTVTYETERALEPVQMVWLDVRNCRLDPIFDVPGGGRPGSTWSTSSSWTAPGPGRIVYAIGHVHGGGKALRITRPECGDETLVESRPLWGRPSHPYYRVRPVLHEPGPIDMSATSSGEGIPVAAGQRLELTAVYDNQLPHTRVMGIMPIAFVPDPSVTERCAPLPDDVRTFRVNRTGRRRTPLVPVPINGLSAPGARGHARPITRPPGQPVVARSGETVEAGDLFFRPANVVVRAGARLRWRFFGETLHNVTLASGPRGFSSPNLNRDRSFGYRFRRPGTYRLYCGLHPIDMTATVTVRRPKRR